MSSAEQPAAVNKANTDDDGMSWWYRWLCKIAGVIGGICEYGVSFLQAKSSHWSAVYIGRIFTSHLQSHTC